jgi:hypothetical protein
MRQHRVHSYGGIFSQCSKQLVQAGVISRSPWEAVAVLVSGYELVAARREASAVKCGVRIVEPFVGSDILIVGAVITRNRRRGCCGFDHIIGGSDRSLHQQELVCESQQHIQRSSI